MLELVKMDLGELNNTKDELIQHCIDEAAAYIATEGVNLTNSVEDEGLIRMYAAYLFRKRASDKADGVGNVGQMPRMLRWTLNNRIMAEKMRST